MHVYIHLMCLVHTTCSLHCAHEVEAVIQDVHKSHQHAVLVRLTLSGEVDFLFLSRSSCDLDSTWLLLPPPRAGGACVGFGGRPDCGFFTFLKNSPESVKAKLLFLL